MYRRLDHADPEQLAALVRSGETFWLDVDKKDAAVFEALGIHDGDDYPNLSFSGISGQQPVRCDIVRGPTWFVTLWHGRSALHTSIEEHAGEGLENPGAYVLHRLADSLVERLGELSGEIDTLEADAGTNPEPIAALRRKVIALDRVVRPQRIMWEIHREEIEALEPERRRLLRQIFSELLRVSADVEGARGRLAALSDLQLNYVTKKLTLVATIFLPLTFVTGFFGQNFKWMIDGADDLTGFLVWGLGGLAVAITLILLWFRRQRLL